MLVTRFISTRRATPGIEPHKIANFTVLKGDPYAVAPMHLKDIKVWGTVFEGIKSPVVTSASKPQLLIVARQPDG
jgi:predicted amidohydrolase YtcJ